MDSWQAGNAHPLLWSGISTLLIPPKWNGMKSNCIYLYKTKLLPLGGSLPSAGWVWSSPSPVPNSHPWKGSRLCLPQESFISWGWNALGTGVIPGKNPQSQTGPGQRGRSWDTAGAARSCPRAGGFWREWKAQQGERSKPYWTPQNPTKTLWNPKKPYKTPQNPTKTL